MIRNGGTPSTSCCTTCGRARSITKSTANTSRGTRTPTSRFRSGSSDVSPAGGCPHHPPASVSRRGVSRQDRSVEFKWSVVFEYRDILLLGIVRTAEIFAVSTVLSLLLGTLIGMLRTSQKLLLRQLGGLYVEV